MKQFYSYPFNIIGIPKNPVDKKKVYCGVPFFTKTAYDVLNTSEEQSLPRLVTTAAHPNSTPGQKKQTNKQTKIQHVLPWMFYYNSENNVRNSVFFFWINSEGSI